MEKEIRQHKPTEISEFERQSVPASNFKDWRKFLGMYAGEHAAGTEFVIGPLFLTAGVSAFDLIVGLILGNFLAVLTWRYITTPIATSERLTLYYKLEKIAGRRLVTGYNLANGLLFCFLAGAMITVSATAVGIPFDMPMPALSDTLPSSLSWILVVLGVGAVISFVAAKGYDSVSRFSNIAAPWMVMVFLIAGIVAAKRLGVNSFADLWAVWGSGSEPFPGQIKFTFWHVVFFAWFCNAAMHLGMSDMTVLRYANKNSVGWTTAAGMYVGHFMAWIAACLMFALYLKSPEAAAIFANGDVPSVSPGPLAYDVVGLAGLVCVLVAGWTTANPTIYRAGLAFQAIFPKSSTVKVTLISGGIATIAGLFPAFAMRLLDFVAVYGFILAPVGAIIFFEHHFAGRFGLKENYAEANAKSFNWAVLMAWLISMVLFYGISVYQGVFLSFFTLPAWITCGLLYLVFSKTFHKK
ncbi:purine-cytosine permease family protein [Shivajiella indica]|uniref:Purine-cytosine permease family protein n=1 Tax=Shivajiella indica TaxID=872115 RepID=A0ABW5BAT2_9BACT